MHFDFKGEKITVKRMEYGGGNLALKLVGPIGQPFGTLTVNLSPKVHKALAPGEFYVKTWSENKELAAAALASGLFVDTGKYSVTGWVTAPVWRFV